MAWDPGRPVPWKRLLTFVGLYSLVVLGIFAIIRPGQIVGSVPGVLLGGSVAVSLMAVLTKFGWNPTMLRSKEELAEARAQRAAARGKPRSSRGATTTAAAPAGTDEPRPKPAPTRRTSTGRTNNPRRTRDNRKR